MNVNHPTISYWDLNTHISDAEQDFEHKTKLYYESAMCLINPKQDPPIFGNIDPNLACETHTCVACDCIESSDNIAIGHEERFLKFVHTSSTIKVELETQKNPLPSQMLIRDPDKFKIEERPYKCSKADCNKTFLLKHHLTTHEKTHTGERPHVCVHCGKSFTHKYCLNTHLLLHTNERPHQCTECNKRFTLKHHLMSHINVSSLILFNI